MMIIAAITLTILIAPGSALAQEHDQIVDSTTLIAQANNRASGTWGTCPWELGYDGTLTVHPGETVEHWQPWWNYTKYIKRIVFQNSGEQRVVLAPDSGFLFQHLPDVTSIDLSGVDTSHVTKMDSMFSGCESVMSLDLSSFDTSSVTNMSYMFASCKSLKNLNVSGFDTRHVTDMSSMFSGCESLTSLDVSGFNTSSVTSMYGMFNTCTSLKALDLKSFKTPNLTDMEFMFCRCKSLAALDLSGFDTSNVTEMHNLFYECKSLETLDLSNWDTSNLARPNEDGVMPELFKFCSALKNYTVGEKVTGIDFPTGFLTGKAYEWYSQRDRKWLRYDELDSRYGIADTYTKSMESEPITDLAKAEIELIDVPRTYDGSEICPLGPYVMLDGDYLVADRDYSVAYSDNVNAGKATVTLTGKNGYTGQKVATFDIIPQPIESVFVDLYSSDIDPDYWITEITPDGFVRMVRYDGLPKEPRLLVQGTWNNASESDYVVTFSHNVKPGKASVSVTGTGNFSGTASATFEISCTGWARRSTFKDLESSDWYMQTGSGAFPDTQTLYIDYTLAFNLMSGYSASVFAPDDGVNRAMAATVIYRLATGATAADTDNNVSTAFADVPVGQWYSAAVKWCYDNNVITGYTDGSHRFGPMDSVTREQLATMISRYCTQVGGQSQVAENVSGFSDGLQISPYARSGVSFCVANGIVGGYTDGSGRFDPQGKATRCQMAKIIAVTAYMLE